VPRRTTLVLALFVVLIAAVLRFYHYFILEQYLLKLLIAISIVYLFVRIGRLDTAWTTVALVVPVGLVSALFTGAL
jgi:hypothetical protein